MRRTPVGRDAGISPRRRFLELTAGLAGAALPRNRGFCSAPQPAQGQLPPGNYDEAKVPPYTLPDPLVLQDGRPVLDIKTWFQRRRPEILELFRSQVYGRSPGRVQSVTYEFAPSGQAFGGTAIRKQLAINFSGREPGPRMHLLIYLPASGRGSRVPVFFTLNFFGNHTISADPGIRLGYTWKGQQRLPATEESRGSGAARWPLARILERGYGLVTAHYFDVEPDFPGGVEFGVRPVIRAPGRPWPCADCWGAIGAWAWAMSRAMDYLETDGAIDAGRVIALGHSRLGKTALWAGAQDTRFAMVISNNSGEGGAALSRRRFGETVADLNRVFPHWFCDNYKRYDNREDQLPVDQHMLLALIAPRPLYVASASEDLWADPRGEFLSLVAAGPVYKLLGKQDLGTDRMPPVDQSIQTTVGYHVRAGRHDLTPFDWEHYLNFADRHLRPQSA